MKKLLSTSLFAALVAAFVVPAPITATAGTIPSVSLIVRSSGGAPAAAAAVDRVGGRVTLELPIVDGVAASVPASAVARLSALPQISDVSPNRPVTVQGATTGSTGSLPNPVVARELNTDKLAAEGVTGAGVRVALIDTGVTSVPDLAGKIVKVKDPGGNGRDVDCVNLSGDMKTSSSGESVPDCTDYYGHGTFLAGLIAGSGASSGGLYKGVAQGAQIVSVKIASPDGSADVSKVLAAIQWVVTFAKDYSIKVVNLSLGTDSPISYTKDPLNYAVERAWKSGLAVVVSAGNSGPGFGTITKPADDPLVITVGAVDDRETPARSDDRLPHFSSKGPTRADGLAKPDVVAPGGRVVSLKAPGSLVAEKSSSPVLDAYTRGSGTSMSAAIVSGVAAMAYSADPKLTPDRLKFALTSTATPVTGTGVLAEGAGLIDAYKAVRQAPPGLANTGVSVFSDGSGFLDDSRGTVRVSGPCDVAERTIDPDCRKPYDGEYTAQGNDYDADAYQGEWNGSSWYGGDFGEDDLVGVGPLGSSWYGSSWYGSSWYGSSWYGADFQGSSWYGNDDGTIYGVQLPGSMFYGGF